MQFYEVAEEITGQRLLAAQKLRVKLARQIMSGHFEGQFDSPVLIPSSAPRWDTLNGVHDGYLLRFIENEGHPHYGKLVIQPLNGLTLDVLLDVAEEMNCIGEWEKGSADIFVDTIF